MRRHDLGIIALLLLLPLILFWQQTIGGKTLLPTENLYQFEPYATYREVVNAPAVPHNHLLSDLVLQNYQWKSFLRDQFAIGEIPLWNPYNFAGAPFMAAGQQSTLYPLSILYYVMPLPAAYGWFTVINLWLAGVMMFLFMRGIGVKRFGALISAITYQLAGMFVASAVHPMIIGAIVWLPLMLLMAEFILQQRPLWGKPTSAPWVAIGAIALACNILAGHPEITIYSLLILAYYSGIRLIALAWQTRGENSLFRRIATRFAWLSALVLLGISLGAVQLIPLYDFVRTNWRSERADLQTVLSYAHPYRDALSFLMPNFYGNPAHHHYFDLFSGQTIPIGFTNSAGEFRTHTEWGMKNYVEGALYVGILPLILALFAFSNRQAWLIKILFGVLVIASLSFAFGLPTYAAIYMLPGINQLNTPFRWIFGVTVGVAVLAGFGADLLAEPRKIIRRIGGLLTGIGLLILMGLLLSRLIYPSIAPLIESIRLNMARASEAFSSAEMFYSYQWVNGLILGLVVFGAGLIFLLATSGRVKLMQAFAVTLLAADLLIASWGFNAASDPQLLAFTPPAIAWLIEREQEEPGLWRFAAVNGNGRDLLFANINLRYGLRDYTGYDSIISAQYVQYIRAMMREENLNAVNQFLNFNRILPLYTWQDVNRLVVSERFLRLSPRYLITHKNTVFRDDLTEIELVYEDQAVRIWLNQAAIPRIYTTPDPERLDQIGRVELLRDSGRELIFKVVNDAPTWVIVGQSDVPGWRVFVRPQTGSESDEIELPIERIADHFQGVQLPNAGSWTVRWIYSPPSFQIGVFGSLISAATLILIVGTWLWRGWIAPRDSSDSAASRLARNSLAPILLNLFNRGIDFVFAAVMFRILGAEGAGFYYYAIAIFGWFDILSNFGLDVYLMREAGRSREKAATFFYNTSTLRFFLVIACIPLLMAVLTVRQGAADPLNQSVLLTIALFYVGLIPGSLSKGLTALFYAFERAEYPAAITTITTLCRIVFGMIALLLGYGIVGLAAVSIVTNVITLTILLYGAREIFKQIRALNGTLALSRPQPHALQAMTGQSFPLMLNHLLATIFFQIDVVLLEALRGAVTVGLYRVAYSWLLAINVIPAFFTQALMPIMSRQAQTDRVALKRTYVLSIKLLTSIALPLAVIFTALAEPLTGLLGGSAYLPDGAIALQIMIWSIPIGWMNSLTQYALIAVDLQRRITIAFLIAVTFNISANLLLIPIFSFRASAVITILSEAVLLIPFVWLFQSAVGPIPWVRVLWRQCTAAFTMIIAILVLQNTGFALIVGLMVYPLMLLILRPLDPDEWGFIKPFLPDKVRGWIV
ncbi:MAG: oligosaccharide flippase family protein [Anaerolineae bacterium]|jgi:O-antigen/teichoic acid export membrane protein|nr:oligosaccharide flippase family protein [Anaerolineae bacterium]